MPLAPTHFGFTVPSLLKKHSYYNVYTNTIGMDLRSPGFVIRNNQCIFSHGSLSTKEQQRVIDLVNSHLSQRQLVTSSQSPVSPVSPALAGTPISPKISIASVKTVRQPTNKNAYPQVITVNRLKSSVLPRAERLRDLSDKHVLTIGFGHLQGYTTPKLSSLFRRLDIKKNITRLETFQIMFALYELVVKGYSLHLPKYKSNNVWAYLYNLCNVIPGARHRATIFTVNEDVLKVWENLNLNESWLSKFSSLRPTVIIKKEHSVYGKTICYNTQNSSTESYRDLLTRNADRVSRDFSYMNGSGKILPATFTATTTLYQDGLSSRTQAIGGPKPSRYLEETTSLDLTAAGLNVYRKTQGLRPVNWSYIHSDPMTKKICTAFMNMTNKGDNLTHSAHKVKLALKIETSINTIKTILSNLMISNNNLAGYRVFSNLDGQEQVMRKIYSFCDEHDIAFHPNQDGLSVLSSESGKVCEFMKGLGLLFSVESTQPDIKLVA